MEDEPTKESTKGKHMTAESRTPSVTSRPARTVESSESQGTKELTKVKQLTPNSKNVNLIAKVVNIGETKEITPKYGSSRRLAEATVGDETGTVTFTLWEDQIRTVATDDVIYVDNGFVSLVRGHIRLNVGKYGTISKSEQDVPEVNSSLDVSAQEFQQERRYDRFDRGGGGGGGGYRSGGGGGYQGGGGGQRQYSFGGDDKDSSRDRSKDRRDRPRRRY